MKTCLKAKKIIQVHLESETLSNCKSIRHIDYMISPIFRDRIHRTDRCNDIGAFATV